MKKLNNTIYQKLLLQAEEARDNEMTKLASGIFNSIGPLPEEERVSYNFNELQDDIYQGLWKMATCVIKYHDSQSADVEKIHEALESVASKLIEEVERALNVKVNSIGPLEDKLVGEE
jgi:hypothetical protein